MISFLCYAGLTLVSCSLYPFDARSFVKTMNTDQKIGQLFMVGSVVDESVDTRTIAFKKYRVDKTYTTQLINEYKVGGILWYSSNTSPEKIAERAREYQEINSSAGNSIPLWFCQDLESNFMDRFGYKNFPPASELGMQEDSEVQETAQHIGRIAQNSGVQIALAPVVDVNSNSQNPVIGKRSFSSDPEVVTQKAAVFIQGLAHYNITSCLKHFPGHGDTDKDSHKTLPLVNHTRERLDAVELHPFVALIKQGKAPIIMSGHLAVPALTQDQTVPASLSTTLIKKVLRKELGFTGLVMTDALDMQALFEYTKPGMCEMAALLAGNDILLSPTDVPKAVLLIKGALADGRLTMDELDEHVVRILEAKAQHFNLKGLQK